MLIPSFSLGEAINQTISATSTVAGVLIGGWLAFRFGVRQLRAERAIDRRVESQEKLLAGVSEYRLSLQVFVSEHEKSDDVSEERKQLRSYMLNHTTEKGREMQTLARRAEMYCLPEERAHLGQLARGQILAYISSWTLATTPSTEQTELTKLRTIVLQLESEERSLIARVRAELSLPELPPGEMIVRPSESTHSPAG
jgi:hypothetical protein